MISEGFQCLSGPFSGPALKVSFSTTSRGEIGRDRKEKGAIAYESDQPSGQSLRAAVRGAGTERTRVLLLSSAREATNERATNGLTWRSPK